MRSCPACGHHHRRHRCHLRHRHRRRNHHRNHRCHHRVSPAVRAARRSCPRRRVLYAPAPRPRVDAILRRCVHGGASARAGTALASPAALRSRECHSFASPSAACCSAISLRARTGVLASSFILEAGGSTPPWSALRGSIAPRICAASATSLVRAPTLKPHPRPSTAPALTVCSLRSRLAGCSCSPPWTTTILSSLGISGAICTHLPPHRLRADASVRTESARRVDFARVDGRVRGARVGTRTGSG